MTGTFNIRNKGVAHYKSFGFESEGEWPPKFWKFQMKTEGGMEFTFTNARRLRRCRLVNDPLNESPICELGFNVYNEMPPFESFLRMIREKKGTIKGVFLNQ
eukprot:GHVO01053520.1.p1 GENE.GHVO01053520.1~~GHVO01053520.1.p1  ORF type:complete len:102 (-),score=14.03 GHVO01053520.1:88-393(-)